MGGTHGFGPVLPEKNEPVFHADWERRVFALVVAMGASDVWSIDMGRFAREHRSPSDYLAKSYYELWLAGLERLLTEQKLASHAELASGGSAAPAKPIRVLTAAQVSRLLTRGPGFVRPAPAPARFGVGERVRAKVVNPVGHTRLPRYVRGRVGVVERLNGVHVYPDSSGAGKGENPQWLYTVRFEGRELWGPDGEPGLAVCVDAFEPYLEPG
jgi:nitrile hydratase